MRIAGVSIHGREPGDQGFFFGGEIAGELAIDIVGGPALDRARAQLVLRRQAVDEGFESFLLRRRERGGGRLSGRSQGRDRNQGGTGDHRTTGYIQRLFVDRHEASLYLPG